MPDKIRPDAAIIVVAVTDEEDAYFQSALSFGQGQDLTLSPANQAELEQKAQPFIDYLLEPTRGVTAFGLYWLPGENCLGGLAANVAHSIGHIVNETGGSGGSICQPDITNTLSQIANASAGIASGLRLRGVAVAPTIEVIHGVTTTGNLRSVPRSRSDGFDYDAIVNRISFRGPNVPVTGDTVVIPYKRWENSVQGCITTADCPPEQKLKCIDGECL
jgi:hypothetical protein